ncbi:phasin family protein [Hwanghaeella grinnelliae]|nr:phasin family protein [Hwanghaeella grinnelliae]
MTSKKAGAAKVDAKQFEEAVANGKQSVEQAMAATKEHVEKASNAALKSYDEFATYGKDSFDVFSKFNDAVVKGSEEFGKAYYTFVKSSADAGAETAKALLSAKTLNEFVEIQSGFARTTFDSMVSESGKLNEIGVKVATEAFEPVQAHMNATVERMVKPLAA